MSFKYLSFLIACYRLRDKKKNISKESFLEERDISFYMRYRATEKNQDYTQEIFDQKTKRLFLSDSKGEKILIESIGRDGIFRKTAYSKKNAKIDGSMLAYHPNGKLFYQTVYSNGYPASIVELYDSSGKKIFRLHFETSSSIKSTSKSHLVLVEEWNDEIGRFVEQNKEHFDLFINFCNPDGLVISDDIIAEIRHINKLYAKMAMEIFGIKIEEAGNLILPRYFGQSH